MSQHDEIGLGDILPPVIPSGPQRGKVPPDCRRKVALKPGQPNTARYRAARNKACPCGSGKLFKKCCTGKGPYAP